MWHRDWQPGFLVSALLSFFLLAVPTFASPTPPSAASDQQSLVTTADIEVFVRQGCPHCAKAKEFLEELKREQPDLRIIFRDVRQERGALERLAQLSQMNGVSDVRVPTFAVGNQLIVGFSDELTTGRLIREALDSQHPRDNASSRKSESCGAGTPAACGSGADANLAKADTFSINFFGHTVSLDEIGLPLFTLAIGLLDGFNPCSMWVLILMISLLAGIRDRPRMVAIAGTFVAVQGVAYFVFMAAWLNVFLLVGMSRISEAIIAALALIAGAFNLKEFFGIRWGGSLSIPASAKPSIYARLRRILQADNLIAGVLGAIALAVLVQIVELMCTSGFPALYTRILTLQNMDGVSYYSYLLLYDLAYMLDDFIVLFIGVVTLSQRRLQEQEGRWLKLVSGLVMVCLGLYLLLIGS